MPKRATKKTSVIELKKPALKMKIKLPLKSKLGDINWKKFLPKSSTQILVVLLVIAAFLIGVLFTKVVNGCRVINNYKAIRIIELLIMFF